MAARSAEALRQGGVWVAALRDAWQLGAFCRTQLAGTSVPYTLVLLLVGLVVGMVSHWADLGYLEASIDQWASIDPHLLLFAFLPGLVFESSFNLEWHTLRWANAPHCSRCQCTRRAIENWEVALPAR